MLIFIILFIILIIIFLLIILLIDKKENFDFNSSIPKVLYLCYKTKDIPSYIIQNWKKIYPDFEVKLYDNNDCIQFLNKEYGQLYIDIFNYLKDGPIKADFWRICILYKYGGIYSDIDNEPLVPLDAFLEPNINFATCSSYFDSMNFNFNPNFIVSTKNNIILKNCIDWYINKYNKKDKYNYWEWSIMSAFTDTLHLDNYKKEYGIYYLDGMKIQIIKECPGNNHYDAHNIYNNKRVFNNRYENWNSDTHSFK